MAQARRVDAVMQLN